MHPAAQRVFDIVLRRDPHQPEFHQAVKEVLLSLSVLIEKEPKYIPILERIVEPERAFQFRVPWLDDAGEVQVNRGFRVQFNSAIGPYKGGLRFHPSVNLSIIKFLGFEQILKNSLTTLPMGGGKGGSDFDPKGKSDNEVMRFCQSFMTELYRHIGPSTDVPAGDIGVGGREVGFLYGQYRRIVNSFDSILTGKGMSFGGSLIRPEATGYGAVYVADEMLIANEISIADKVCLVSGSGNVCQYTIEKLLDLGAKPVSCSDSQGSIYMPEGFTREALASLMELKNERRGRLHEFPAMVEGAQYFPGEKVWQIAKLTHIDMAFPSATQNEIDAEDAKLMIENGLMAVSEGANMPSTMDAIDLYLKHDVLYAPAKLANCGGVMVSGLEMSQNAIRLSWTREEVDEKLSSIIRIAFRNSEAAAVEFGEPKNYMLGANIAGFRKVADAMLAQGCI